MQLRNAIKKRSYLEKVCCKTKTKEFLKLTKRRKNIAAGCIKRVSQNLQNSE